MRHLALLAAVVVLGAAAPLTRLAWSPDALPAVGEDANARDGGVAFQALAMVGREDRISSADSAPNARCIVSDDEPVAAIAARARDVRVVIVNEAHDAPRDRAFAADLAEALRPLGYRTLAAETLSGTSGNYQDVGPDLNDGSYSAEPAFGDLLRRAKAAGYRFLTYEDTRPGTGEGLRDIAAREEHQARTLAAWLGANPGEKLLVYVGYSHNRELTERVAGVGRIQWMAERLADKSKLNPLTIDQTTFAADRTGVCATAGAGAALPLERDMYVAHAPLTFQRSRPTWRLAEGQRFVDVPRALRDGDARIVVEARLRDDPVEAVPADRIMIDPGETIPLLLPPGRYKARAWNDGAWGAEVSVTVREMVPQPVSTRQKTSSRRQQR